MSSPLPRKPAIGQSKDGSKSTNRHGNAGQSVQVLGTNAQGVVAPSVKSATGQYASQNKGSVLIGKTVGLRSGKGSDSSGGQTAGLEVRADENDRAVTIGVTNGTPRDMSQDDDFPRSSTLHASSTNSRRDIQSQNRRDTSRRIFANRSLNLENIKFFGFDMDYTMAVYASPTFESFVFRILVDRLVTIGYPPVIKDFEYDPTFPIRGLWCDSLYGTLLKTDQYGSVLVATSGFQILPETEVRELYPNKFVQYDESRFSIMNTLFELPVTYIAACLIDYFTNSPGYKRELTGVRNGELFMPYRSILTDVRDVTDYIHDHSSMKADTIARISEYITKDRRLPVLLDRIRGSGAKTFLLTNSPYDYTNKVMTYLLHTSGSDDGPERDWRSYFDYIVVDAQKPRFFHDGNTLREVDLRTGAKRLGVHEGPLQTGLVYSGGSCEVFSSMIGAKGRDVMYVGDHVFGDILKSKKVRGWRTFLIVPEVAHELLVWTSNKDLQDRLDELEEALKVAMIHLDSSSKTAPVTKGILDEIKKASYEFDFKYGLLGSVFKSGSRLTFFASQLMRYADIYSYCVCNLLNYPLYYHFRAELMRMPHEATVDQNETSGPGEQHYAVSLKSRYSPAAHKTSEASTQGVPHSRPVVPENLTYYDEDEFD